MIQLLPEVHPNLLFEPFNNGPCIAEQLALQMTLNTQHAILWILASQAYVIEHKHRLVNPKGIDCNSIKN